jgi:hypothetical protein
MDLPISITGTLTVIDPSSSNSGTVISSSTNDFHLDNFSKCIVLSLSRLDGFIDEIQFGNGGTITSPTNTLTYKSPQIVGSNCSLYNKIYSKCINPRSSNFISDPLKNYIKYEKSGTNTARIVIYCTLGYAEPSSKYIETDDVLLTDTFTFDEVALSAIDGTTGNKILLTHWISTPITKKLSKAMEFIYTIDFEIGKANDTTTATISQDTTTTQDIILV